MSTRKTRLATTTTHEWIGHHAPAIPQPANQLMTENQGGLSHRAVTKKSGDIRTADAGDCDGNLFFSCSKFGARTFLHLYLAGSGINESTHGGEVYAKLFSGNIELAI